MRKAASIIMLVATLFTDGHQAFNKLYQADVTKVDLEKETTSTSDNNAFGECKCDVTLGSCDVYCCCDLECNGDVRNFWLSNYNDYCAKNSIMQKYKPYSQCIDSNVLSGYNKRMGMSITNVNNQVCVQMDVGSVFSTYKQEVDQYTESQAQLVPDTMQVMLKQQPYNENKQAQLINKYSRYYMPQDQVMLYNSGTSSYSPFFLPQAVGFNGICMNAVGVEFLMDIDGDPCQ